MKDEPPTIADIARLLGEHIRDDGESHKANTKAIKKLSKSLDQIQRMPMQVIRWIVAAIATATIASGVNQYWQHEDVIRKAEIAASAANESAQQVSAVHQQLSDLTEKTK